MQDRKSRRAWSLAAQDGIIATAGILLGFAGAGAGDATLLMPATAATVAGMLSAGGAEWSKAAAERAEVIQYYEAKRLSPGLAITVADQLMVRSPLKAALESEHGILKLTSRAEVLLPGIGESIAYALGAAVPSP